MAENFKILIPARIGSERLSRKLLQKVGDKTIIQMTHMILMEKRFR